MDAAQVAVRVATPVVVVMQDGKITSSRSNSFVFLTMISFYYLVAEAATAGVVVVGLTPVAVGLTPAAAAVVAIAVASAVVAEVDVVVAQSSKLAQLSLINV